MVDDILTVMWKERKGLFRVRGRRAQVLIAMRWPASSERGWFWIEEPQ